MIELKLKCRYCDYSSEYHSQELHSAIRKAKNHGWRDVMLLNRAVCIRCDNFGMN
jgi:hypothetical protein